MEIRVGNVVGRKSYKKDIFFIVDRIYKSSNNKKIAILKGLSMRIIADSNIEDLELINKEKLIKSIKNSEICLKNRIKEKSITRQKIYTGKILHLDGDRKYSEKSAKYYSKMGLNFVVKNISEKMQSKVVISLLKKYNPDILVITGHDAMYRKGSNYHNIYNYRNSRTFYKHS